MDPLYPRRGGEAAWGQSVTIIDAAAVGSIPLLGIFLTLKCVRPRLSARLPNRRALAGGLQVAAYRSPEALLKERQTLPALSQVNPREATPESGVVPKQSPVGPWDAVPPWRFLPNMISTS